MFYFQIIFFSLFKVCRVFSCHLISVNESFHFTYSSIHDVNSFNFERVITIKGKLENICKAEQMISSKLRQSYENDLAAMAPSAMMFPGLHPMNVFSTINQGYPPNRPGGGPPPPPPPYGMYGNPQIPPYNAPMMYSPGAPPPNMEPLKETVHLYIPNSAVGAIIGTGGSTIRDMISSSGAIIKVSIAVYYLVLLLHSDFSFYPNLKVV